MHTRIRQLEALLASFGQATVALSGGVDSGLLGAVTRRALGDRALALTIAAPVTTADELEAAHALAVHVGIRHEVIDFDWLSDPRLAANGPDRCYHCKRALFETMLRRAEASDRAPLLDGTNADDDAGDRPGMRALGELGVPSPLRMLGFTKAEVRWFARTLDLPGAGRPSTSCLATRIPTNTVVTVEALRQIERAEQAVRALGYRTVRVRHNGPLAIVELAPEAIDRALNGRARLVAAVRQAGFSRVGLDLEGYRGGATCEDPVQIDPEA